MKGSKAPLILSLLFLVIFTIPVFYLIYGSIFFKLGNVPTATWQDFLNMITSPLTGSLLLNTVVFAVFGGLLAVTFATIYAWIVHRTDVPGKRILGLVAVLPLTTPFLVKAFSWIYLFSPNIGIVNIVFHQLFGIGPVFNIYSMYGLILALGTGGMPLAYLTIEPAIKSLNPHLEEASRIAGHGLLGTLRKITIPVLLPAIFSAFLLEMIIGLENFDYPFLLGGPGGVDTLATEVYFNIFDRQPPRYASAAMISVIYIILTMSTVAIYIYATRKAFKFVTVTGKAPQRSLHKLHRWKYVGLAICIIILFFTFILNYATLILMSFTYYFSAGGGQLYLVFSGLKNYGDALNLPLFYNALGNSIILGLAAGIIATIVAVFLSYAALKSKVRGARLVDFVSTIPLAFPGIVYGLALFWTFLLLPGISGIIYGTIWPLVLALVFVRLPYSVRMISGSVIQIADELEESSRVSGASWGRTFYKIVLPLLKGGMLNSFLYTFINSIRELGAIVLLTTGQTIVLTTLLLQLYSQHPLALNTIAAASVMLSLIVTVVLAVPGLIQFISERRKKKTPKS